jgi:hypothetical protein
LGVTISEVIAPPPADFWFKSDVTIYDPVLGQSIVCHVSHHFGNIAEIADAYYTSHGDPVQPEVPPKEVSSLPSWVQAILDALYIMLAPLILVFEVIKMLISWVVGLLGYIGGAITMVVSFGILLIRWASVAVASVVSFGSASPGGYVSIGALWTMAGISVPGGSSVFSAIDITAASVDVPLEALHTWIMASTHQWIWWGAFTYGMLAWVMQLGGGGGDE